MSKNGNSLGSFIMGALLGWAAGMMLAPEKGSKVRKKMGRKAEELKDMLGDVTKNLSRKAQNMKSELETKWVRAKNSAADKIDRIEDELGT